MMANGSYPIGQRYPQQEGQHLDGVLGRALVAAVGVKANALGRALGRLWPTDSVGTDHRR